MSWHRHQNQLTAADWPLMLFISSIRLHEMKEKHQRNGGKRGPLRRSLLNVASGKGSIGGGAFWRGRGVETKMTFVPSCCLLLFKALVCGSDLPTITSLGNGKKRERKKSQWEFSSAHKSPSFTFLIVDWQEKGAVSAQAARFHQQPRQNTDFIPQREPRSVSISIRVSISVSVSIRVSVSVSAAGKTGAITFTRTAAGLCVGGVGSR